MEPWFKPLVWMDYRLSVVFAVIIPLILMIWAVVKKSEAMTRLLIIYWRVSSLLMITVYLMVAAWPIGFVTAFAARILIPTSLWFWVDINEEIREQKFTPLKLAFTSWRWAVSVHNAIGAIALMPFLSCAFSNGFLSGKVTSEFCLVWIEPTYLYKQLVHNDYTPGFLGFLGAVGLVFYLLYFSYFAIVRLVKQGRVALEQ